MLRLGDVRTAYSDGNHNAFTDLVRFQSRIYLCFRSSTVGHGAGESAEVVVVGDRATDLEAARRLGCRAVFVRSGATQESALGDEWGEVPRFDDLRSAVDRLLDSIEERA